jgi:hypothetical protein
MNKSDRRLVSMILCMILTIALFQQGVFAAEAVSDMYSEVPEISADEGSFPGSYSIDDGEEWDESGSEEIAEAVEEEVPQEIADGEVESPDEIIDESAEDLSEMSTKHLMILAVMMVMTISANAMSYNAAKNEALFLSDKMAYELNLTTAQYEAVYEINLDYLMSLNGHADVFGIWWDRRNADLRYVLNSWQYDKYVALSHFYRPVAWKAGSWTFAVYTHYTEGISTMTVQRCS